MTQTATRQQRGGLRGLLNWDGVKKIRYRPWDIGIAALAGIVTGVIFSVVEQLGREPFPGWTPGEIAILLSGRLTALGVLFAGIAYVRNAIARRW